MNLEEPLGSCWTPIRYEKLPNLYSYCETIGHSAKDCGSFYLAAGSSSQKHQYRMWMQFSRRSSSLFRSPNTSPLRKSSTMVDIALADNNTPTMTASRDSPLTGSGSRPMEISPVMEDSVMPSVVANTHALNENNLWIDGPDSAKVKNKL